MINIYFAKPSRSIDSIKRVVKITHIKYNCYVQDCKSVAKIPDCCKIITQLFKSAIIITYRNITNDSP